VDGLPVRRLLLALPLLALGCLPQPPDQRAWPLTNGTPAQEVQAAGLVAAAWVVTGDVRGHLAGGGAISLFPELGDLGYNAAGQPLWGVAIPSEGSDAILLLAIPMDSDMRRTALRHELCHVGLSTMNEDAAEACSANVLALYEAAMSLEAAP
jgi:hypothetical protein